MDIQSQPLSTERVFICNVLRCFVNGTNCPDIPNNLDWERLEKILTRNQLIPIFYFMLNTSQISKDRIRKWKHFSIRVLSQYCQALKSTAKLFSILETERIPAVALRGLALAEWIYPEPSLRPMKDVDILIQSDARHKFVDQLKKYGLLPCKILRSQFVYCIDSTVIEIHWSFLTPKRYRNAANFNQWLISRRSINTAEGQIYCLKPEDELLELICHVFIHHELDRLLQITDIAILVTNIKLDWDYLRVWCKDASMTRLFCFTMAYVNYFFDLSLQRQLARFNLRLSPQIDKVFDAYASYLFNEDSIMHFIRRKKNMLFVAEQSKIKFKQLVRFLNTNEISNFSGLLFNAIKHGKKKG